MRRDILGPVRSYGPRPPRPTKTCGRCGTTFPTRHEWEQHTWRACNDSIAAAQWDAIRARTEELERNLLFGGMLGRAIKEDNRLYRENLTIEVLEAARRRLGPPVPEYKFKPLVPPLMRPNEVWIFGNPDTLKGLGIITNIGEEKKPDAGTD